MGLLLKRDRVQSALAVGLLTALCAAALAAGLGSCNFGAGLFDYCIKSGACACDTNGQNCCATDYYPCDPQSPCCNNTSLCTGGICTPPNAPDSGASDSGPPPDAGCQALAGSCSAGGQCCSGQCSAANACCSPTGGLCQGFADCCQAGSSCAGNTCIFDGGSPGDGGP
jgi:hypothetical protein